MNKFSFINRNQSKWWKRFDEISFRTSPRRCTDSSRQWRRNTDRLTTIWKRKQMYFVLYPEKEKLDRSYFGSGLILIECFFSSRRWNWWERDIFSLTRQLFIGNPSTKDFRFFLLNELISFDHIDLISIIITLCNFRSSSKRNLLT